MKLKVENFQYELIPIPPHLAPYNTYVAHLLQQLPKNCEEAKRVSDEMSKALDALFAGTVKPQPEKKHYIQVFNALNDLTKKVMEDAGLFRQPKGQRTKKSSPTEPHNSSKT
ncbi:MAG: hypothetical protein OEZ40_07395 [Candidatus Bathyarchaeota archaeon]|nr:hypothetical protein [Candidatus Bathyarchaeota archaeon]